jgi:hypothetical protein
MSEHRMAETPERQFEAEWQAANAENQTEGAHESFAIEAGTEQEVERVWREFWRPALVDRRGKLDPAKLKRELYDLHHLIHAAPSVYSHVTGGMIQDPCASAEAVIAAAESRVARIVRELG